MGMINLKAPTVQWTSHAALGRRYSQKWRSLRDRTADRQILLLHRGTSTRGCQRRREPISRSLGANDF